MAIFGIGGGTIGTTSLVRAAHADIHAHSTSNWATGYSNTLAAGTYHVHYCLTPSANAGDVNNNDPDAYELRCTLDGTVIGVVPVGTEAAPHTYQKTKSISFVIGWTSGSKTLNWDYRTTDPDSGGVRGKMTISCSRILSYS